MLARRNGLTAPPLAATLPHQRASDPTAVESLTWTRHAQPWVRLYTVRGGGHVVPQPRYRFARLLGRTTGDLDAPVATLRFSGLLPSQPLNYYRLWATSAARLAQLTGPRRIRAFSRTS